MRTQKMFCYNCMTLQKSSGKCFKCGTQFIVNVGSKLHLPKNLKKSDYKELSYYLFYQYKNVAKDISANKIEKVLRNFPLKNDEDFQNKFTELQIERNNFKYNNERPKNWLDQDVVKSHDYGQFYATSFLEPYTDYLDKITFSSLEDRFFMTIGKQYFESELLNAMLFGIMELEKGEFFKIVKHHTNGTIKKTLPFKTKKDCREFEVMLIQDFKDYDYFNDDFTKYIKNYHKVLKMKNRIADKYADYFI